MNANISHDISYDISYDISHDDRSAVAAKHRNKNQDGQNENKKTIKMKKDDPNKNNPNNKKTIQTKTQDQRFFKKNEIGKPRKPSKSKPR